VQELGSNLPRIPEKLFTERHRHTGYRASGFEIRDSIGTAVRSVNHLPGIRFYWRQRKSFFQPTFIARVEDLLAREPLFEMEPYWQDGGV
jgi:hypothetical protein